MRGLLVELGLKLVYGGLGSRTEGAGLWLMGGGGVGGLGVGGVGGGGSLWRRDLSALGPFGAEAN